MELNDRTNTGADWEDLPEPPRCGLSELAPADAFDPVVEAFKKDVDRTLFAETLRLSPNQRSQKFLRFMEMVYEFRRAGQRQRAANNQNIEKHDQEGAP